MQKRTYGNIFDRNRHKLYHQNEMEKNLSPISSDLIRGNVDTIVLKCLQIGDLYGLEICDLVKRASDGTYILKQPTLYSSLKRLEKQKLITGYWKDSMVGGRRHYYKLSDSGLAKLTDKKGSWSDAKGVIDTLVGDLRQRREEMLDEQAANVAEVAERLAHGSDEAENRSGAPNMQANESTHKTLIADDKAVRQETAAKTGSAVINRSLIEEIVRERDTSAVGSYKFNAAGIPKYDSGTDSDYVTTVPLTTGTESSEQTLKPFIFNADLVQQPASGAAEKDDKADTLDLYTNSRSAAEGAAGAVSECAAKEKTKNTPLSFKPKAAADKLSDDGEILNPEYESVPRFSKYLSPDDYARTAAVARTAAQHVASAQIAPQPHIIIKPFQKQGVNRFGRSYVHVSRLRFVCALAAAAVAGLALFALLIGGTRSEAENAFFTLAFIILGTYVVVNLVLFAMFPKNTRKIGTRWENAVLRIGLFAAITIVVFGVNFLGGLTSANAAEYSVYWAVPCVLASIIVLEGVLRFVFSKLGVFSTR